VGGGLKHYGKVVWPGFDSVTQRHVMKVGRNDPCPCGSGRKYKDCHRREGTAYLEKLAYEQDRKLSRERREQRKAQKVPWYRRLFGLS